jgi:hypothetical protein
MMSGSNESQAPKVDLPHIDKLVEKICVVDRTRGIISPRTTGKVDCPTCQGSGKVPDFMGFRGRFDELGQIFVGTGLDALWFAGGWYAGVWTGPQHDLICVKKCGSNAEAEIWLSPEGANPEEATRLALEKQAELAAGRRICHRCGFVGAWPEDMEWCSRCHEELAHERNKR